MSVDANAEGGPPKAVIAEVDVDVKTVQAGKNDAGSDRPSEAGPSSDKPEPAEPATLPRSTASVPQPEPILTPISSSDIFRGVFTPPPRAPPMASAVDSGPAGRAAPLRPGPSPNPPPSESDVSNGGIVSDEEFQRRLRGEYEAAQRRLGDVVTTNLSRPLRLSSIRLSPSPPVSRPDFLSSLVSPFIRPSPTWLPAFLDPSPGSPRNLQEILHTTRTLVAHLDKFGVYDMDRSSVKLQPVRGGDVDEVELVLGLRERGRLFLKAGTEVGGGEGGGNVTARIRNALGGAETLELNASIGTKTKSAYQASLSTPVLGSPLLTFALQGFSFDRDNTAFASHREEARGGRAKLSAIAPWGTHDLTYEYIMRDITHLSPSASVSIRELAHPTTKSSISHTWTSDTRDDTWTGTAGRLLKLTNEFSGLPGSSAAGRFFKSVFQTHASREVVQGSNIRVSLSSITSALLLLYTPSPSRSTSIPTGHPLTTPLPDRVFLGGPNSVRGWRVGGMGLRDNGDSLGGDLAWALGASVFAPIPRKEHWGLRLHGFMNVGKVVRYRSDLSPLNNIDRLVRNPNVSVGVGLMYRLEPIRIELNVSMPLVGRKGEGLSRGLGVGVGIEFL